jgi:hypothetical protein
VGQNGVLPLSPNHYYVCLIKKGVLYPQVFLCPHGFLFIDGFCHPVKEDKDEDDKSEEEERSVAIRDSKGKTGDRVTFIPTENKIIKPTENKITTKPTENKTVITPTETQITEATESTIAVNPKVKTTTKATEKTVVQDSSTQPSRTHNLFSTEKPSTFAPDAFLADKFDMTNYESTDDGASPYNGYDYANSFESGVQFW